MFKMSDARMDLSDEDLEFLNELLRFNIEARYPKDRVAIRKWCTGKYTEKMIAEVRTWQRWLAAEIRK